MRLAGARLGFAAVALALALLPFAVAARETAMRVVEVRATPITHFRLGSDETRFGGLEFVGGLELGSPDRAFGQLSAMRFLSPGGDFIGVADHGYWFFGTIRRDASGVPAGLDGFRMQPILGRDGQAIADKSGKDAEGLDVADGVATVSFEREARVSEFAIDGRDMGPPLRDLDFVVPRRELRMNQGIETVLRARRDGIHDGARIVIAERSIDRNGDIFAAILEGPHKGIFKVRRSDSYDVTDGVLLPGTDDVLLLERRFSAAFGVGMRIRRIRGETIREGALADGPVIMEADLGYRIDNMEALDVWRREDGALIVSLLSDDNQSFLQRTIYLEFVLSE